MKHECLMALWVSVKEGRESLPEFISNPEFKDFLHPGEIELIKRVINIGKDYHFLQRFIDNVTKMQHEHRLTLSKNKDTVKPLGFGTYLVAFCSGLKLVLNDYLTDICYIENNILVNPQYTLPYILGIMEKYVVLLKTLKVVVQMQEKEQVYGCLLIGRMNKYIDCGIESIEKIAKQVVFSVNKVFYNQLSNWLIFGNIKDIHNEFFIGDCETNDEDYIYPWEQNSPEGEPDDKEFSPPTSHRVRKFIIRQDLVPSVMHFESVENILFVGRLVWILQNDPRREQTDFHTNICDEIWANKAMNYISEIQAMSNEPFMRSSFEKKIGECRQHLTKHLWKIMLEVGDLLEHLQLIRDYYCLGRGELFQHFICNAEEQITDVPAEIMVKNLNYVFGETARAMYGENDSHSKFQLAIPYKMKIEEFVANPLGNLEMYMHMKWPLHIIFKPKIIALFNKLFSFLMRVKKTHITLHQFWSKHQSQNKIDSGVWSLRHNLILLVNNLQYYLQVDIIETQFSILIESIKNNSEYTDVVRMHSVFISNLLLHTFVISLSGFEEEKIKCDLLRMPLADIEIKPKIYQIIVCLLELCDNFCLAATNWNYPLLDEEKIQLDLVQQNLDTILENLFRALISLNKKISGHHLLQLLHRLDFNRWFTSTKPDLNLSVI